MRFTVTVIAGCFLAGCFYVGADDYEAILSRPSTEWSSRDRLSVIAAVAQNNFHDKEGNVSVSVIPYYPSVITAINRTLQAQKKLSEDEYGRNIARELTSDTLSDVIREHADLLDENGIYHKNILELDSLIFYVCLTNKSWPCTNPIVMSLNKMTPLFSNSNDVPCPTFDISDLASNVYLENDQHLHLHPKVIWGRRHESLTSNETLLMLFQFRSGEYHFFKKTKKTMWMVFDGFEREIVLEFPISKIR